MRSKALVTGATGYVGKHLVEYLLKQGVSVVALVRNPDKFTVINGDVEVLVGDLTTGFPWPHGVTHIYHCAGVISQAETMWAVNVDGTKWLLEQSMRNSCRLVALSSAGVAGSGHGYFVDEQTHCNPGNDYEKSKYSAEKILLEGVKHGADVTILRPAIIFGNGRPAKNDSFLHLIRAVESGRYRHINRGNGLYNIIHLDEVCRCMYHLSKPGIESGSVFIVSETITFREFAKQVQVELLSHERKIANIPQLPAYILACCGTLIQKVLRRKFPFNLARYAALTNRVVFLSDSIRKTAGYEPDKPLEDYLKKTIDGYCQQGSLTMPAGEA